MIVVGHVILGLAPMTIEAIASAAPKPVITMTTPATITATDPAKSDRRSSR